jgi:hypothetical protein
MTTPNPITPPPELMEQWMQAHSTKYDLAREAAQWGADTELEECCEWFTLKFGAEVKADIADLRAARRPKPPSLKEQARSELIDAYNAGQIDDSTYDTIRRALEELPE